jgi:S-formylglutathione hydrolase
LCTPVKGTAPLPTLFYLAGLACTEETFPIKAGAQRFAAEHGLMLIAPDTSPRGAEIDGETQDWTYGTGAGFYVDATQEPWQRHYQMESYVAEELHDIAVAQLNAKIGHIGVFGHSMGGHGALVLALRHPHRFKSVSAFAPIVNPTKSPRGETAFTRYLGSDRMTWRRYDATELILECGPVFPDGILIDQGLADIYLASQLNLDAFVAACKRVGQPLKLRTHAGYDHGYYFIQSFVGEHITHHSGILERA